MIFGHLNYQRHPEDTLKRVFYYRNNDVFQLMLKFLDDKNIHYDTTEEDDGSKTYYVIIHKDDFDSAFECNARAMVSIKKPIIQDTGLRIFLFAVFFAALVFSLIGYIITNLR